MEARPRAKHVSRRSLRTWDGKYIGSPRPPPSFWVEASTLPTCQNTLRLSSRLALRPMYLNPWLGLVNVLIPRHLSLRLNVKENLLRTMIQIENSFFALAEASERNCLVICDRGTMDASAFVSKQEWDEILQRNMCDEVDIRDNRYHQVSPNSPRPACFLN